MADNEESHIGILVELLTVETVRIAGPVAVVVNYRIHSLCIDIVELICIGIGVIVGNGCIGVVVIIIDKPSVRLRIGGGSDNGCVFYRSVAPGKSLCREINHNRLVLHGTSPDFQIDGS